MQFHRVMPNWEDWVKWGDGDVNEDGVAGGIEKFKLTLWNIGRSIRFRSLGREHC